MKMSVMAIVARIMLAIAITITASQPSNTEECYTPHSACKFPFIYKGVVYNQCTKTDTANGKAWCATQTNRRNQVIRGRWVDCNNKCSGLVSTECYTHSACKFPFIYKGVVYNQCTKTDTTNGKAWCATQTNHRNQYVEGRWVDCDDKCSELFKCESVSEYIPYSHQCDGIYDCTDNSDESPLRCSNCKSIFTDRTFSCGQPTTLCIHKDWECDLAKQCPNGEDEYCNIVGSLAEAAYFPCGRCKAFNQFLRQCQDVHSGPCRRSPH